MAIWYVRQGASGANNGTDWTNAYTTLPADLTRGDTYYIAAGSYGSYTFDDPGTTTITIKKATVADHGSSTGWNDSYATGQAVWTYWLFSQGGYTFNGVTGGGPGSWASGHGIAVRAFSDHLIQNSASLNNLSFSRIEFDGTDNTDGDRDVVYFVIGTVNNVTFSRCYFHDIGSDFGQIYADTDNWVWEYCYATLNNLTGPTHGDFMESDAAMTNWVVRWNWFDTIRVTYVFGTHESGSQTGLAVYGNVFENVESSNGLVSALSGGGTITDLKFYNNTVVNGTGIDNGIGTLRGSNNLVYNNVWYGNVNVGFSTATHDYNAADFSLGESNGKTITSAIFTNYAGGDFTLSGTFPDGWAGTDTSATLSGNTTDLNGNTRGADGTWDRGAYEYAAAAPTGPASSGVLVLFLG